MVGRRTPKVERPYMPPAYGIEPESTLGNPSWDTVRQQLVNSHNYWLATTRPDGKPHLMPVWGLWLDDAFHFSTDTGSRKGKNLAANPFAVVHLESGDDVVVVEGRTETIKDERFLEQYVDAYDVKYKIRPDVSAASSAKVYRLQSAMVFSFTEADYPRSAARWVFDN